MKHHVLKMQVSFCDAKLAGRKPFEVRENDRDFQLGDTVEFVAVTPDGERVPHDIEGIRYEIPYVLREVGLLPGWVAFTTQRDSSGMVRDLRSASLYAEKGTEEERALCWEAASLIEGQESWMEALRERLTEKDRQLEAAVEAFESAAHSGGNLCEFCGAECCDAGVDDPDTFQCGAFKWRGAQEAGEVHHAD